MKQRKKYTQEFKCEAVALVNEQDHRYSKKFRNKG